MATCNVRTPSRSITPRWGPVRYRPPTCTYAPRGPPVRVGELATSRKYPPGKYHRSFSLPGQRGVLRHQRRTAPLQRHGGGPPGEYRDRGGGGGGGPLGAAGGGCRGHSLVLCRPRHRRQPSSATTTTTTTTTTCPCRPNRRPGSNQQPNTTPASGKRRGRARAARTGEMAAQRAGRVGWICGRGRGGAHAHAHAHLHAARGPAPGGPRLLLHGRRRQGRR